MTSYLQRTKRASLLSLVILAFVAAALVSVVTAFLFMEFQSILVGEAMFLFEGLMMILAGFLLTSMIVWLALTGSRLESKIESQLELQASAGSRTGIFLLIFALVLREGVEIVLFTMAFSQPVLVFVSAIAIGLLSAGVVGIAILKGSLRISTQSLFHWSSLLLILVAAGMFSNGIHEVQEAGVLLIGPIELWNLNPPATADILLSLFHENGLIGGMAAALFGYNANPSLLEVVVYIGYLAIVLPLYLSIRRYRWRRSEETPHMHSPRSGGRRKDDTRILD